MYNAVAPLLLAASTCAPASSNFSTTREWPLEHATTKPVLPSSSALSKSTLALKRVCTTLSLPLPQATKRGVPPLSSLHSTSFFTSSVPIFPASSTSLSIVSTSPLSHAFRKAFGSAEEARGGDAMMFQMVLFFTKKGCVNRGDVCFCHWLLSFF